MWEAHVRGGALKPGPALKEQRHIEGDLMNPFDIAFELLKEEVIDMVEMPPGSGNFVSRAEALATMRAQGAPMTDPNASSAERIRQAMRLRQEGM